MKTKKEILLVLIQKLGLQKQFVQYGFDEELNNLNNDLSNLPNTSLANILNDRDYLQNLVTGHQLAPCVLGQSVTETAEFAGARLNTCYSWESLNQVSSLIGIVEKIISLTDDV